MAEPYPPVRAQKDVSSHHPAVDNAPGVQVVEHPQNGAGNPRYELELAVYCAAAAAGVAAEVLGDRGHSAAVEVVQRHEQAPVLPHPEVHHRHQTLVIARQVQAEHRLPGETPPTQLIVVVGVVGQELDHALALLTLGKFDVSEKQMLGELAVTTDESNRLLGGLAGFVEHTGPLKAPCHPKTSATHLASQVGSYVGSGSAAGSGSVALSSSPVSGSTSVGLRRRR